MLKSLTAFLRALLFPPSPCNIGALLHAATTGDCESLNDLLKSANPNRRLADGSTLLINVSISEHLRPARRLEVLELLLRAGSEVDRSNRRRQTPLMYAVGMGEESFCVALLDAGASLTKTDQAGDSALIWATSTAKLLRLSFLIERGANVSHQNFLKRTPIMYAARNGSLPYIEELLAAGADARAVDAEGNDALLLSCLMGKSDIATRLAALSPDRRNKLSLHAAASVGFDDIVASCLGDTARLLERNEKGFTALELAVMYRRKETLQLLLPHYKSHQAVLGMALGCATLSKSLEIMQLLLEQSADPNVPDEVGDTALIHAARSDFADGVRLLLKHGAEKKHKNKAGDDAQDAAQSTRSFNALQALFRKV